MDRFAWAEYWWAFNEELRQIKPKQFIVIVWVLYFLFPSLEIITI
jgi:hypothetical protein